MGLFNLKGALKYDNTWILPVVSSFVCFLVVLVLWRRLNPNHVLFYQGVVLAIAVSLVQFAVQKRTRSGSEAFKNALIAFLLCYCFMFTVPTTVDRSYSVSLILELDRHPEGRSRRDIEQYFAEDFVRRGGVRKRLDEQLASGVVTEKGGRYELTALGRFLAQFFGWTRRLFSVPEKGTRHRLGAVYSGAENI